MYEINMGKLCHKLLELTQLAVVLGLGILICMPVFLLFFGSLADGIEWTGRM